MENIKLKSKTIEKNHDVFDTTNKRKTRCFVKRLTSIGLYLNLKCMPTMHDACIHLNENSKTHLSIQYLRYLTEIKSRIPVFCMGAWSLTMSQ